MLVYSSGSLKTLGYTDSDFQGDIDSSKSTSGYVFTLNRELFVGGVLNRLVLLTPRLKLNMWLHLKLQRKLYGLRNSFWIFM